MNYIDLFCGIGGFHQALSKLGCKCVLASDSDKYCREIYEKNYGIKPLPDVRKIVTKDMPDFDVLCAGFPCQPFSINRQGNRDFVNETDDRVNLYQYLIEICRIKKPEYILFENVAKLETVRNSEDKLMIDVIISSLRDIGYKHIKYRILDAADFGVAQQRKRIFIVACRSCDSFTFPKTDNRTKIKVREILEENVKSKDYKEVFKNNIPKKN